MLNQPNRLYVSSDDAIDNNSNHSGHFEVRLDEPIYNVKKASLVSAEYTSSFYNIDRNSTFTFNEIYKKSNGEINGRIQFSVDDLTPDNYTATELATALTNKLNAGELVGKDTDPKLHSLNEELGYVGLPTPVNSGDYLATEDPTNTIFVMKKIIDSSDTENYYLADLLVLMDTSHLNADETGYAVVISESGGNYNVRCGGVLKYNSPNYLGSGDYFSIPLEGLNVRLTGVNVFVAVILPPNTNMRGWNVPDSPLIYQTNDASLTDEIISMFNGFEDFEKFDRQLNYNLTPVHNASLKEPVIILFTYPIYNYSYNAVGGATYLKSKFLVNYDENLKRFDIEPVKEPTITNVAGNSYTATDTIPFFKHIVSYGLTTKDPLLTSFLEIPVDNIDKSSINFIMGSRDRFLDFITYTDLLSNNANLRLPSIPRIVKYPYIFITADFIRDSYKTGKNQYDILHKLPIASNFGSLNFYNNNGSDNSIFCDCNKEYLQTLRFQLVDKDGFEVDLNGGELSLTIYFEY